MKGKNKMLIGILIIIVICGCIGFFSNKLYVRKVMIAIENNDLTSIKELMDYPFGNLNCKPSLWIIEIINEENESTPLQAACKSGNLEIVKLLLENGAKVNYTHWDKTRNQGSPLTNAASSLSADRLQIIKLLIQYGADVNYVDYSGNDVLSCAVYSSCGRADTIEIIEYLEQNGVDIYKEYSETKNTLLHKACERDNYLIVEYLIEKKGFDVNVINNDGDTPLIYFLRFASNRKKETLLLLLEHGANKEIKNHEGKTAYDYASLKHPEFINMLN